jgi:hypothetical protein
MTDMATTAGLIALAIGLMKIIEVLVAKVTKRGEEDTNKIVLEAIASNKAKIDNIDLKMSDLHKWHDNRDADGVFTWYVRRSLEEAIKQLAQSQVQLAENIRNQTNIMEGILKSQEETRRDMKRIASIKEIDL